MRKRFIKKQLCKLILLIIGIPFLLWNCQKDSELLNENQLNSEFKIKTIQNSELKKNQKIVEILGKISSENKTKEVVQAKNIKFNNYNFTVNTNNVKYIEKGDYHSYTFSIIKHNSENKQFQNLLLSLNNSGEYDCYLVKYDFTIEEFRKMTFDEFITKSISYQPIQIDYSELLESKSTVNDICIETQEYQKAPCCNGDLCEGLSSTCISNGGTGYSYEWVTVATDCFWINSGGGTADNSPTDPDSENTSTSGGGDGGIVTAPNTVPYTSQLKTFVSDTLNSAERTYYNRDSNIKNTIDRYLIQKNFSNIANLDAKLGLKFSESLNLNFEQFNWVFNNRDSEDLNDIQLFLDENLNSSESESFAIEAIEAFMDKGDVDFEDNIIYHNSLNNLPCQKLVIEEAVGTCSPLTQLVLDIFEANDGTNLIFKSSTTLPNVNANTSSTSRYNSTTHTCDITITFRESYLQTATDLAIARTAIHESLHATLVYMFEENLLQSANGTPMNGFEDFVEAYINHQAGLPANLNVAHHELMANFIDEIASGLSVYGASNGHSNSFNFYKKLSWSGDILKTPTYQSLYPEYLNPLDATTNPSNVNPAHLDIVNTSAAEENNSTYDYVHPNGTTYTHSPKGTAPNETLPCN